MAKTKISEFSTTAGNNTDINSINIAEGCAPSGINDAIRELMRQLKEFQTGGAGDSVNSGGDFSVATNKFTVASATGNTAVAGTLGATGDFAVNTNKFTVTAASGNTAVAGTLASTGNFAVNTDKFSVTAASGNTSVAGTLGATGDFAVNTDKFTVAASSGNTAVAGTLGVTGVTTLTGALVANGNSTLGDADTDTVTLNASFVTGTTLKTAKSDTNTLALAAYDVDGTAYTNLVTLTAGNTPSLALTSTAVGTINNMSIGATTASTGAFTTLSASGNVTLSGGTANGVLYLNGSKVATAGSALVFDGTNLGIGGTATALGTYRGAEFAGTTATTGGFLRMRTSDSSINSLDFTDSNGRGIFTTTNHPVRFGVNDTEQMRLTSTGLGIGTSSPTAKLNVVGTGDMSGIFESTGTSNAASAIIRSGNGTTSGLYAYARFINNDTNNQDWRIGTYGNNNLSIVNAKAGTTPVVLDSSGNLGLGVTPSAWASGNKFMDVNSSASFGAFGSTDTMMLANAYWNGSNWIRKNAQNAFRFVMESINTTPTMNWQVAANGAAGSTISFTQAMTLDASGNLLVGTTSTNPTNGFVANQNGGNGFYLQVGHPTGTGTGVAYTRYMYNQTEIGSVTQSGTTAVLYNTTSDQRLKENIVNAPEFGSVIDSIKVRSYDWKADGSHQRAGFVAQELVTVAPEAVHQPADPEEMMAVDYSKLVPMLVKEIQSLRARVTELESN